jgi:hypothetical protein
MSLVLRIACGKKWFPTIQDVTNEYNWKIINLSPVNGSFYNRNFLTNLFWAQDWMNKQDTKTFSKDLLLWDISWWWLFRNILGIDIHGLESDPNDKMNYWDNINWEMVLLDENEMRVVIQLRWSLPSIVTMNDIIWTVKAAKKAWIKICPENLGLIFAIRSNEWEYAIDVHKGKKEIDGYNNKLTKVLDWLDRVTIWAWDYVDSYFKIAIANLIDLTKWSSTSQYDLFLRSSKISTDLKSVRFPESQLKESIAWIINSGVIWNKFEQKLKENWIKKIDWESNYDVLVRMFDTKPWTFGKYELDAARFATYALSYNLWEIGKKIGNPADPTWSKKNLVWWMQWRNDSWTNLSLMEIDYAFFTCYIKPAIDLYTNDWILTPQTAQFAMLDHHNGIWACAKAWLQNWINLKLSNHWFSNRIRCDWDLTTYDRNFKPVYNSNSETVNALLKLFPSRENEIRSFVEKAPLPVNNSSSLFNDPIYNEIMWSNIIIPKAPETGYKWQADDYAEDWKREYAAIVNWSKSTRSYLNQKERKDNQKNRPQLTINNEWIAVVNQILWRRIATTPKEKLPAEYWAVKFFKVEWAKQPTLNRWVKNENFNWELYIVHHGVWAKPWANPDAWMFRAWCNSADMHFGVATNGTAFQFIDNLNNWWSSTWAYGMINWKNILAEWFTIEYAWNSSDGITKDSNPPNELQIWTWSSIINHISWKYTKAKINNILSSQAVMENWKWVNNWKGIHTDWFNWINEAPSIKNKRWIDPSVNNSITYDEKYYNNIAKSLVTLESIWHWEWKTANYLKKRIINDEGWKWVHLYTKNNNIDIS